jgi:hypothetical protein
MNDKLLKKIILEEIKNTLDEGFFDFGKKKPAKEPLFDEFEKKLHRFSNLTNKNWKKKVDDKVATYKSHLTDKPYISVIIKLEEVGPDQYQISGHVVNGRNPSVIAARLFDKNKTLSKKEAIHEIAMLDDELDEVESKLK